MIKRLTALSLCLLSLVATNSFANTLENADITLLKAFAAGGDLQAQYHLGIMYSEGLGVEQNASEAFVWIKKAAEQGLADAQLDLGSLYDAGEGVSQDYHQAALWYRKAAEQGVIAAQYNLAVMFETGEGLEQNLLQAYIWYTVAEVYGYKGARPVIDELVRQLPPEELEKADHAVMSIVNRINTSKSAASESSAE